MCLRKGPINIFRYLLCGSGRVQLGRKYTDTHTPARLQPTTPSSHYQRVQQVHLAAIKVAIQTARAQRTSHTFVSRTRSIYIYIYIDTCSTRTRPTFNSLSCLVNLYLDWITATSGNDLLHAKADARASTRGHTPYGPIAECVCVFLHWAYLKITCFGMRLADAVAAKDSTSREYGTGFYSYILVCFFGKLSYIYRLYLRKIKM